MTERPLARAASARSPATASISISDLLTAGWVSSGTEALQGRSRDAEDRRASAWDHSRAMTSLVASAIQRVEAIVVAGPQNWNSGKGPETLRQPIAQLCRHRVAIRQLAAVRLVDRPRRRTEIMARRHIVPPEHVGAGKGGDRAACRPPRSSRRRQPVGLPPEHHFHLVAEQPAIADDAVIARRQSPVMKAGLNAAGDGRRNRLQRPPSRHRGQAPKAAASTAPDGVASSPTTIIASTGFNVVPPCHIMSAVCASGGPQQGETTCQTGIAKWHAVQRNWSARCGRHFR